MQCAVCGRNCHALSVRQESDRQSLVIMLVTQSVLHSTRLTLAHVQEVEGAHVAGHACHVQAEHVSPGQARQEQLQALRVAAVDVGEDVTARRRGVHTQAVQCVRARRQTTDRRGGEGVIVIGTQHTGTDHCIQEQNLPV